MVGTTKMWFAWLLGGLEYAWVAKDGLLPYTKRETNDYPSFMSLAVNQANEFIDKSPVDKINSL
jgi:hypothetical protein